MAVMRARTRSTTPAVVDEDYEALVSRVEQEEGIPPGRLVALGKTESNLNPRARNRKSSATGMFQFIDSTGREVGLVGEGFDDRFDPEKSARAAAKMLKKNAEALGGDWDQAVQAHHTGLGAVKKYGGPDPSNPESVGYLNAYRKHYKPSAAISNTAALIRPRGGLKEPPKPVPEPVTEPRPAAPEAPKQETNKEFLARIRQEAAPVEEQRQSTFLGRIGADIETGVANLIQSADMKLLTGRLQELEQVRPEVEKVMQEYGPDIMTRPPANAGERALQMSLGTVFNEAQSLKDGTNEQLKRITQRAVDIAGIPQREVMQKIAEADSFGGAYSAFLEDPLGAIGGVTVQSMTQMLPALVAGMANPRLGIAMLGGTSYTIESGLGVLDYLNKEGIDTTSIEALEGAIADPALMEAAQEHANTRGAIIGGADLLSGGLASKLGQSNLKGQALNLLLQPAAGAGGEAAAQLATEGEITEPGGVFLEAVGEAGTAVPEALALSKKARDERVIAAEERAQEEEAARRQAQAAVEPEPTVEEAPLETYAQLDEAITKVEDAVAVGDSEVANTLIDRIAKGFGEDVAREVSQAAAAKAQPTPEEPAPTPTPEVAPTPEPVAEVTPPVAEEAPPVEVPAPVVEEPTFPEGTPERAIEVGSGLNSLAEQFDAITLRQERLKGRRSKRRIAKEEGAVDSPLGEMITVADDMLSVVANSLEPLGAAGYDVRKLRKAIFSGGLVGTPITKGKNVGQVRRAYNIGIEKAKKGDVLRNREFDPTTGKGKGAIRMNQLRPLVEKITTAYDEMLQEGPVLATKKVGKVGAAPIRKEPTVSEELKAKQRAKKEAEEKRKAREAFALKEREAAKERIAAKERTAEAIRIEQQARKAAATKAKVEVKPKKAREAIEVSKAREQRKTGTLALKKKAPVPKKAPAQPRVKLKAKPLPEVKPTPTKTSGSLRTYERVDVAAGVAEALGAKHGNILDAGTQAVVSPANSNGDMNGGIDLVYLKKWPKIEAKVKGEIRKRYGEGQMPIGDAFVVETGDKDTPYLVVSPTMAQAGRQTDPKIAGVATLAAMKAADDAGIKSMAFPGMGTGIGRLPAKQVRKQMDMAQDYFEAYQDGEISYEQAKRGLRGGMDVNQFIKEENEGYDDLTQQLADEDTRSLLDTEQTPVVEVELPAGSSRQQIETAIQEQMKSWRAEARELGDRVMYLFHGTSKRFAEKVAVDPDMRQTQYGLAGVFAASNPKDAIDWAASKFGDENVGLTAWAWTEKDFQRLMDAGLIRSGQMEWGSLEQAQKGTARTFTEYVVSDAALRAIYDDHVLTETAEADIASVPYGSKEDVRQGREYAATALDQMLGDNDMADVNQALNAVVTQLDPDDPVMPVLLAIQNRNVGLEGMELIAVDDAMMKLAIGSVANGAYSSGMNRRTGQIIRRVLLNKRLLDDPRSIKTFAHELVHAATMAAMRTDNKFAREMEKLRKYAYQNAGLQDALQYGFTNVDEFVAEALTNPQFQKTLAAIRAPGKRSAWAKLIEAIRNFLGMDIPEDSVLSNVVSLTPGLLMSKADIEASIVEVRTGKAEYVSEFERRQAEKAELEEMAAAGTLYDELDTTPREFSSRQSSLQEDAEYVDHALHVDQGLGGATQAAAEAMQGPSRTARAAINDRMMRAGTTLTGMMTNDTIESTFEQDFAGLGPEGNNPMVDYYRAMQRRAGEAKKREREADKLNNQWERMENRVSPKDLKTFNRVVLESTMYEVDPSMPWQSAANKKSRENKKTGKTAAAAYVRLRQDFNSLPDNAKAVYREARDFYKRAFEETRAQVVSNVLDMYGLDKVAGLKRRILNSRSPEEMATIPPPLVTRKVDGQPVSVPHPKWKDVVKNFNNLNKVMNSNGPYFPQMRFGDFVFSYTNEKTSAGYTSQKAAQDAARKERADTSGSKTRNFRQEDDGKWYYDLVEEGFETYETEAEAVEAQAARGKEGFDVGEVHFKTEMQFDPGSSIGQLLAVAGQKLNKATTEEGKAAAQRSQQALQEALITMLPETSMQKRMLKRRNIRGANVNARRVFANYAKSYSRHLAGLKHGKEIDRHLVDISRASKESAKQGRGRDANIRVGKAAREIMSRHNMSTESGPAAQVAAKLGFLGYLFSLSYSAVNATQPLLMALPYLTGKHGSTKAGAALSRAYAQVGGNVIGSAVKNGFGLKAIASDIDLNKLTDNIIDKVGKDTGAGRMLTELTDLGIIDATFSLEISEAAKSGKGPVGKLTDKVVDIGRTLPYTVEIMNRVVTALAGYDLEYAKTRNHARAVNAAHKAVVKTQFDYSMENRPRYFKLNDAAKIMTMFKIHPLGVYTFLISNVRARVAGASAKERIEAGRALRMFLLTHAAFAGAAGSLLMEPIKAAIGLVDWLWDWVDEDDEESWRSDPETAMRKMLYELTGNNAKASEVLMYGLPRAAGFDMANRVGLQNMMIMLQEGDTTYETVVGSIKSSLAGPLVGGATESFSRAAAHYANGGGLYKSLEYAAPKGVRDLMKGLRYRNEGMTDFNGNVLRKPEDFTSLEIAAKMFGFSPSTEAETYAKRSAMRKATMKPEKKRRALMNAWNKAEDKAAAWEKIREFNERLAPDQRRAYRITRADLIKSRKAKRRVARETKEGVRLRKDQRALRERLEIYN